MPPFQIPTVGTPQARMSTKMSQDAKKDEFRKYLEKAGVLELLTKSLVQLYEVSWREPVLRFIISSVPKPVLQCVRRSRRSQRTGWCT